MLDISSVFYLAIASAIGSAESHGCQVYRFHPYCFNINTTMPNTSLTHLNTKGEAQMVSVSGKSITKRMATAEGKIAMQEATLHAIVEGKMPKGDVLATARIAAIMAAKQTSAWIPLCHPIPITGINIELTPFSDQEKMGLHCIATVETMGQTGVEMEAMTAVSAALLTLYDMGKAMDRFMTMGDIRLVEKIGGKSGHWVNPSSIKPAINT